MDEMRVVLPGPVAALARWIGHGEVSDGLDAAVVHLFLAALRGEPVPDNIGDPQEVDLEGPTFRSLEVVERRTGLSKDYLVLAAVVQRVLAILEEYRQHQDKQWFAKMGYPDPIPLGKWKGGTNQ